MIALDNLDASDLRKAIEFNFIEILKNNPNKFDEYFKRVYEINHNMVSGIFKRMVDDKFAEKYPYVVLNTFKFILITENDDYSFRYVPIVLYTNNKKEYLDLLKIALNNCTSIFSAKYLLNAIAKNTNDSYFLLIAKLLDDKSAEYIDAHNIFSSINDIHDLQEIYINWNKYCSAYYQQSIYNVNDTEKQKDILCKKLYNISFEGMKNRYYQYIIANHTNEIDKKVVWFKRIIMSTTKEEIIQIYNETIDIGNELKTTCEDIAKQIDIDSKKSISDISKYQVPEKLRVKTIGNIGIYDISETNFNLIIHNISACLSLKHKEELKKYITDFSIWSNPNIEGSITISTSEISNKFLGHVTRDNYQFEVIFAFSNIPEEEVFFSGTYDIGLNTSTKNYSELNPADGADQHFLANQLMTNCFDDYNEIAINRYYDKTKAQKRLPNYIVCYDEINELSLKYAEYFNIPILFIDTSKCAHKNAYEIKQKIENINNPIDMLNSINEFFSFICGLKYSNVVYEIAKLYNWEEIIINSITNYIDNTKSIDKMKEVLMIISYIEKNIPMYFSGIKSKFNNYKADYSEIVDRFANFPQKISSIRETVYNELAQVNVALGNNESVKLEESQNSGLHI